MYYSPLKVLRQMMIGTLNNQIRARKAKNPPTQRIWSLTQTKRKLKKISNHAFHLHLAQEKTFSFESK
jgi:hypothetical protein